VAAGESRFQVMIEKILSAVGSELPRRNRTALELAGHDRFPVRKAAYGSGNRDSVRIYSVRNR